MRVLIAHNRYRRTGGEERHVDLLHDGLHTAGIEVRRFERDSNELTESVARRAVTGLAMTYRPGSSGLPRVLREWSPTIVHFHNIWPLLTPSALRAAKRSGAGVVLTVHNYRFACPGGTLMRNGKIHEDCIEGSSLLCGLRRPREKLSESILYGIALEIQRRAKMLQRWVDAFVAPSDFVATILIRAGVPKERVRVVPHGVPLTRDPQPSPRRNVLYFGRLVSEKGIRTVLAAAQLCPSVPIAIAGEGPLFPEIRTSAPHNVTYLGHLDSQELTEALANSAFTIVPSEWYDPLTFTALESLEAGRAVVASRMGGLPQVVEHESTGLLIPPADPRALANAMTTLWEDPDRAAAMGRNARATAERRFALDRQTEKVLELYERIAGVRSGPSKA